MTMGDRIKPGAATARAESKGEPPRVPTGSGVDQAEQSAADQRTDGQEGITTAGDPKV